MILVGDLAISLNLLSIAVLTFIISVVFVTVTLRLTLFRLANFTFGVRKILLWSLVTAPWWIAATCVGIFWPRQQNLVPISWLDDFAHWHHVDIFSFTSWHAVTLFAASSYLLWSITRTVYTRYLQSSALLDLIGLSDAQPQQIKGQCQYYSLPLAVPAAFTIGFISPRIYLTTALQQRVNEQDLDIIVKHELAHVNARDPLFKVAFAAFAGFFPAKTARNLTKHYILLTEQIADSAVTQDYDNLHVAQTLINVTRMQRSIDTDNQHFACHGMHASHFGNDQISLRIQRLINPNMSSSRLMIALLLTLFVFAPLLTAFMVDSFHHVIETFFTH